MVKKLGKFTVYIPDNPIPNGIYLQDEAGLDWYESQKLFSMNTIKIVYYGDGSIDSYSKDVSALWPINAYISEINDNDIPDDFSALSDWVFCNGMIIKKTLTDEEITQNNIMEQSILLDEALSKIQLWQTELLLESISDENKIHLMEWISYIKSLQNMTALNTEDINWPKKPE